MEVKKDDHPSCLHAYLDLIDVSANLLKSLIKYKAWHNYLSGIITVENKFTMGNIHAGIENKNYYCAALHLFICTLCLPEFGSLILLCTFSDK